MRVVPGGSATVTFSAAAADLMMTDEKVRWRMVIIAGDDDFCREILC